ncbi:MAG: 2-octaprenyl-6-methoxyphenyl hydroxylase [Gammaproteobacteria bacterium]|nr:2-octaprenyl-6-methoxyphenyl hydroxylase [Gammaproteobacteria bacterium]
MSAAGALTRVDVAIVGGGLVGAALALALAPTRRSVLLIEAVPPQATDQPSFDDRCSALGNGSRRVLETLGVWSHLGPAANPIRGIHISDAGHFGAARLEAAELGLDAFGCVVPNRSIGAALWRVLGVAPIARRVGARVGHIALLAEAARLAVVDEAGAVEQVEARVVIAADGAHSMVRAAAGIQTDVQDYHQVALIANLEAERCAGDTAYERFTPTGPLVLLPLADGRYAVVWTLAPERARQLLASEPGRFITELQAALGWRVGRVSMVGRRVAYPLALRRAQALTGMRAVLVGNAAQTLHPVAAQGYNLGLRDAATLAEHLAAAEDPGAPAVLAGYAQARTLDRRGMIAFTDGLVRLFGVEHPLLSRLRGLGLAAFDLLPPAKRALARVSWGFGGDTPRLLRGVPLA